MPEIKHKIDTGQVIYSLQNNQVYKITSNDSEQNENGIFEGTVTLQSIGNPDEKEKREAEDVIHDLMDGRIKRIDDKIVDNAREIICEFAHRELRNYSTRIGKKHTYNGIDGVESIADLFAAYEMMDETNN